MVLIDTNILLRYILQDHVELTAKANDIIINNSTICLDEVVYESIHVLTKVHKIDRKSVASTLLTLFQNNVINSPNTDITIFALKVYQDTRLDFIDCLLIAYRLIQNQTIISFDKDLNNYITKHTNDKQT